MGALKRGGGGLEPPYELWLDDTVDHNMFIKKTGSWWCSMGCKRLVHVQMKGRRQFVAIKNDTSTAEELYDII